MTRSARTPAGPPERSARTAWLGLGLLSLTAAGLAWLVTSGLDGGIDVPPPTAPTTSPVDLPSHIDRPPAPERPVPLDPPSTAPPATPPTPPAEFRITPATPEAEQRIRAATAEATTRRIDMLETLFETAPMALQDEADRARVQALLDGTVDAMRALEGRVASGAITYRDAVEQMDALRTATADRIAPTLRPDEAAMLRLRMGIQPPPEPVQEWDGVPFEEATQDWR